MRAGGPGDRHGPPRPTWTPFHRAGPGKSKLRGSFGSAFKARPKASCACRSAPLSLLNRARSRSMDGRAGLRARALLVTLARPVPLCAGGDKPMPACERDPPCRAFEPRAPHIPFDDPIPFLPVQTENCLGSSQWDRLLWTSAKRSADCEWPPPPTLSAHGLPGGSTDREAHPLDSKPALDRWF